MKLKVADNNIIALRASLVSTPTIDSLVKKDAIIADKDAKIATKIANVAIRDVIIGNLNANISQMQLSINVNKVDRNFLINIKGKF